jgi:AAA+ superfamily predicted ATPase
MSTKSQTVAEDIAALLRARNPLLWIVTREEARTEQYLVEAGAAANYLPRFWDVDQGTTRLDGKRENVGGKDPGDMLDAIREKAEAGASPERGLWILRDLPVWLEGPGGASVLRKLRNLARFLPTTPRENAQAIVIVSPSAKVPDELGVHATVIEWPLPDHAEIGSILDAAVDSLPESIKAQAAPNGTRDAAIDAAIGLSGEEAASCFARSIVKLRKIDPAIVSKEKRRVVAREGILEWFDPLPGGLDAVGGLDCLKAWLTARASAYSSKAREYGLPAPKGALLVGVPGCGKSLTAKAIATAWNVPLLRLDLGALKSKFVGDSEANLRKAFRIIEVIGRCVVWLDEIEKALQGATSGSADGGVSSDALGAILSWMQDRRGEAFVIATANDVSALPPELLRKGRFDELWFVDLPTEAERAAILAASLRTHGRTMVGVDSIASQTEGFTGAELAALVPDALFTAFNDGQREPIAADLAAAAATVVPLAKTAAEKITTLRNWANGRARRATSTSTETKTARTTRTLDL